MALKAYYLFRKSAIPADVDPDIAKSLEQLSRFDTRETYVRAAYDEITTQYSSGRINTVLKLFHLFSKSLSELWHRKGFMHCTNQNYLFAVLLVKGGLFHEDDIRRRWTLIGWVSPHQYLKIRLDAHSWIAVDCWGRQYGVPFGEYAHGFNSTLHKSFAE